MRGAYQQTISIRIEKDGKTTQRIKELIQKARVALSKDKDIRQVRIAIDVDPY